MKSFEHEDAGKDGASSTRGAGSQWARPNAACRQAFFNGPGVSRGDEGPRQDWASGCREFGDGVRKHGTVRMLPFDRRI